MKIIAAVDGTKYSEAAIDALMGMNWPADTQIKILTVLPAEEPGFGFVKLGPGKSAQHLQELEANTLAALKNAFAEREKDMPCKISYEVLAAGDAKSQIVEAAKNWAANLIVMGSRGARGVELMLLGSVSQGVLNTAPCPVIIVKSDEHQAQVQHRLRKGYKSLVLAVDSSQYSLAALNWLKSLKWSEDTKLTLVTVVQSLADAVYTEQDAMIVADLVTKQDATLNLAKSELQNLAKDLSANFAADNIRVHVAIGDPREAIMQAAQKSSADLIVMGSHGRTGLTKLFIGSVSQAVSVHAPCSVAIIRGVVPKGKMGQLNQSGLFTADTKEELMKFYAQVSQKKDES